MVLENNKAPEIVAALRKCPVVECAHCKFVGGGEFGCELPSLAAALIEKLAAEPPNDPLTLEELREMNGEPVWVEFHKRPKWKEWRLVNWDYQMNAIRLWDNTGMWWRFHPDKMDAYLRKACFATPTMQHLIEMCEKIEAERDTYRALGPIEELSALAKAQDEGRVVVLDMPCKPLVWRDDDRDTALCPDCGKDLMGLYDGERIVLQCPECGQYLDDTKIITRAEAEAALGGGGDG